MKETIYEPGPIEPILSWTRPVTGHLWHLFHHHRCSHSLTALGLFFVSALSACHYFTKHRPGKPHRIAFPWCLFLFVSLLGLNFLHHERCHAGHFCGPVSDTTFVTPSGVEVPLNSITRDRLEDWASTAHDPMAIEPQQACHHYLISNIRKTWYGLTADLDLFGRECNVYGQDVSELGLVVEFQAKDRLHVEILPRFMSPKNESWFVLYEELIPKPKIDAGYDGRHRELDFILDDGDEFGFTIKRMSTGETLFTTAGTRLVFEDQFFELKTRMPVDYNVYGLGEVMHGFRLSRNFTRTLFNADAGDPVDENIYGSHPIYLDTRYYKIDPEYKTQVYVPESEPMDPDAQYTSYTHGVFLRNAHALEILLREQELTFRGLGGTLDFYFYAGPTAKDVIREYQQSTVGLPAMQQYYTLGYHQCRWGYTGWEDLQRVINEFGKANIPLETIWADIDYMYLYRNFENDPDGWGYEEGAEFLDRLHKNGQHFVPIVDSAIYAPNPDDPEDKYPTFERGFEARAFMMNPDGSLFIGQVWPGFTVFPDWVAGTMGVTTSKTFEWWTRELRMWYQKVNFDGIWIDMSEVSSFCEGSCGTDQKGNKPPRFLHATDKTHLQMAEDEVRSRHILHGDRRHLNRPPYMINNVHGHISIKTASPDAVHHGGMREYDVHNLFGHQILNATYNALLAIDTQKRPFIIGRSTFAGSGKYAGHWGGDNYSLWSYLYLSIPQALAFSIFGIPFFGVDACGFSLEATPEMCARWMELSAFFPFYRNHNEVEKSAQEPYIWPEVAEATRRVMKIRYSLLPYFYTLMFRAHERGDTVLRAMAWEFPDEPWLAGADRQFLVGPALLVTPVLNQGATSVKGVFPGVDKGTVWYDWYTQEQILNGHGENITIRAPLEHIPLHVRGGHILPLQEPGYTTRESRDNEWGLLVALDEAGKASGEVYIDDGESLHPQDTLIVHFSVDKRTLLVKPEGSYKEENSLHKVTIMGVEDSVSVVSLEGKKLNHGWSYDDTKKILTVELGLFTADGAWRKKWVMSWK